MFVFLVLVVCKKPRLNGWTDGPYRSRKIPGHLRFHPAFVSRRNFFMMQSCDQKNEIVRIHQHDEHLSGNAAKCQKYYDMSTNPKIIVRETTDRSCWKIKNKKHYLAWTHHVRNSFCSVNYAATAPNLYLSFSEHCKQTNTHNYSQTSLM